MTPIEKDKLVALCAKWKLTELGLSKGIFMADDNSGITMNLRGDIPIIGVMIAGSLKEKEEEHGLKRVEDLRTEANQIMKAKPIQSKSSSTGRSAPFTNEEAKGSDPSNGGSAVSHDTISSEKKLGTPDTSKRQEVKDENRQSSKKQETPLPKKSTTTAVCECGVTFKTTLYEAQDILNKYGKVCCEKCRMQPDKPVEPAQEIKPNKPVVIRVCKNCGVELSGARALECFQKDPQKPEMICEICEENKGDNNMNERLPETIEKETESKLTVGTIKQYICSTATDAEAYNFLQLCLHRDLNPFLKEAYLIKYGNQPATMVVGKDAFTRKAEESGKLDGFEAGIIIKDAQGTVERRIGVVQFDGDTLIGGWAKIFRKDMKYPFVCEVPLSEYIKRKQDGSPQSSWATMPGTMIRKVALVQSLREAFTKELGGCYDAVEMGAQDTIK